MFSTIHERSPSPFSTTLLRAAAGIAVPLSLLCASPSLLAQPSGGAAAAVSATADDQVPVRKITLYRSGVGYFERSGNVSDNAQVQLRFKTEQINDILKSMVLLDLDGGRIESVSYGSKEPLAKRLASFGINIADNPTAAQILDRLRGTAVKLFAVEGEHTGTIMNIEQRRTVFQPPAGAPGGGGASVHELPWINLLTRSGVRSYDLTKVSGFEILDKELASELDKALSTLAEYRADTTKTVDLRFSGTGSRRVVVGYVNETPVWKTSYRLVLPEADPPKSDSGGGNVKGELVMQGWAIVENTTDQDWNNVRLSLVSGRPVSFQMDLYEPLFTFRPSVPVPTIPGVMPRAYAGGIDGGVLDELQSQAAGVRMRMESKARSDAPGAGRRLVEGRGAMAPGSPMPAAAMEAASPFRDDFEVSGDDMANYAARAQAQAAEVGEVFQYQVEAPVTVERQRSAMIPILNANITGRRVSIFSQGDTAHPMRGVELVNESNLQLLPGPIAVFDGAAYAGDAQINHIAKGDKRLISYALDLDVAVITKPQSDSTVRRVRIVDGLIVQTVTSSNAVSYAFDNKDAKRGRTIIVEHPRYEGWTLKEPAKAAEETATQYRFEVEVEPGKARTFSVVQERTDSQSVSVTSIDMETVLAYHKNGKLSDAVLKAVQDVGRKQGEINATEREIAELDRQRAEIDAEQGRIRENMGRIERTSQLYTRYMTKLSDQENQLESMREARKDLQKRLETQRQALAEFLRTLNAE
ncbi:MAG: hypothetical protein ACK4WH_00700 [Phycisphaerales bacterium]